MTVLPHYYPTHPGVYPQPSIIPQPTTYWPTSVPNTLPMIQHGCICPAGANKDCENPVCPRKAPRPFQSATSIA